VLGIFLELFRVRVEQSSIFRNAKRAEAVFANPDAMARLALAERAEEEAKAEETTQASETSAAAPEAPSEGEKPADAEAATPSGAETPAEAEKPSLTDTLVTPEDVINTRMRQGLRRGR